MNVGPNFGAINRSVLISTDAVIIPAAMEAQKPIFKLKPADGAIGAHTYSVKACEKPRIKCGDYPHQKWLPVTDDVIRRHLSGVDECGWNFVAGVYPMLLDEHCHSLAVDFEDENWSADTLAYMETCRRLGDTTAYRRERRKDFLLQTYGYRVLRFLADDLGRELNTTLDTVMRAMAGRCRT